MNKKIILIFTLLALLVSSTKSLAAATTPTTDTANAGIIPSNIWYSDTPDTQGKKVRIYTVVFNPNQTELSGTVSFFDNDLLLGKKDFAIPTIGTKEVYIEWNVTLGTHKIYAKIDSAKYLISKGKYEDVSVKETTSEMSAYTVYKPVLPNINDIKQNVNAKVDSIKEPINNVEKQIVDSTPSSIANPIISSTNFLENWRNSESSVVDNKKDEVKSEIDAMQKSNNDTASTKDTSNTDTNSTPADPNSQNKIGSSVKETISTPFKFAEFFLFTILSIILGNKYLFYVLLVIIAGFVIKVLWKAIFK